ncbi:nucleotidyltransferase substrate binding protein [Algoriphagus sp.]|uniref:nucleotidyltransferase substrate binding protein n=1 Tax=Algoriphagus sp. TaxID=1872435 RepID=UPI00391B5181
MSNDIRWEQRFENFNKAFSKLNEAIDLSSAESLSELEIEGLIQRFEYTYELSWKTLQDVIKKRGYLDIGGPGAVLKQAFELGLIDNPEGWRRLKKSRELTSHTYYSGTAMVIYEDIKSEYVFLFEFLKEKLEEERSGKQETYLRNEIWDR